VLDDSMPREPIQGQGHETFRVRNSSIFKVNGSWHVTGDS